MRIVIDYQGAQSGGSRNRGIGRYTSAVTRAILRSAKGTDIILLLNGAFEDTVGEIRKEYEGLLPNENIIVWKPLQPSGHIQAQNHHRRKASELLREAFIARLNPDALLITSHFEGSGDDGVSTIGRLPAEYTTAVILYDLIPYIYRSIYLPVPEVQRWYEERIGNLSRADLLLAISESSRQEAIDLLGFRPADAISISTAADDHFRPADLSNDDREALYRRYGIERPFVMYTGGIDHRKNIEGLIRAYAKLPADVRKLHQLAVVCSIRPEDGPRLQAVARDAGLKSSDVILTGFVPEEDLVGLYSSCKLFVFPSWHEGFGLPALEAMWCGAPVIAGDRSSLPEVIGDPEALFDPRSDKSIRDKMLSALTDEEFRRQLIRNGADRAATFSWNSIGQRALEAINSAARARIRDRLPALAAVRRPRMAMVSPAPPAESGIANYAATLIRGLLQFYEIDLVLADGLQTGDAFILSNCRVVSASAFRTNYRDYDRVVYQFGNSDHHSHMVELIQECPGIIVLHDFFVSDLSSWREHLGGIHGNWGYDLYESHGIGAVLERHANPDLFSVINKYPCSYAVTRHALSVICHSEEARALQVHWHGQESARNWHVVPMIRQKPRLPSRDVARDDLGIGRDEFVACAFGILGRSKLNHRLIEAWIASKLGSNKTCRLVFVGGHGSQDYYQELVAMVRDSKVGAKVEFSGWVDEDRYWSYLSAADVAIQLRGLSHGETSAATLDAMLSGLPIVANKSPALPVDSEDAFALVAADAPVPELATALKRLHRNADLRASIGKAAERYASERHSVSTSAAKFSAAVEQSYRSSMVSWNAAIDGFDGLELGADEAAQLADGMVSALDDRETLFVDVSSTIKRPAGEAFPTLQQLFLHLGNARANLRAVAVFEDGGRYRSAMPQILRLGMYPHVHEISEPVTIKSIDRLVTLSTDDAPFARTVAELSGAALVHLELGSGGARAACQAIREFVDMSAAARRQSIARYFKTPEADPGQARPNALKEPVQRKGSASRRRREGKAA